MIIAIAVSVYLILMNFIAVIVDSFMYYASITAMITTDYHGDPEDPFFVVTACGNSLYVTTIFLIFEIQWYPIVVLMNLGVKSDTSDINDPNK